MRIRETHTHLRQPIQIRRMSLRMPAKAMHTVIEIITDDEDDILLLGCRKQSL